jgi:hypothetical protein
MRASDSHNKRRRRPRTEVTVLADVSKAEADAPLTTLVRDISVSGAKFLTNARFDVGEALKLHIRLSPGSDEIEPIDTPAQVVRIEPLPVNRVGVWSKAVAVTFERELTEHQDALNTLGELARRAWQSG